MASDYTVAHHPYPKASDLWYRKVRAFFKALDVDNNGYLSLRDKCMMTEYFIKTNHRVQHSQAETRFKHAMDDLWAIIEIQSKVTYEDYLHERLTLLEMHHTDPEHCKHLRCSLYEMFFDFIDLKREKKWDAEETAMYFSLLVRDKYTKDEVAKIFPLLDSDGDGFVTFDDYAHAYYTYEFDQEPSKYDAIFGPLPDLKESKPNKGIYH